MIICPWTQFPSNTHLEPIQVNFLCHYGHLALASSGSLKPSINIRTMLARGKWAKVMFIHHLSLGILHWAKSHQLRPLKSLWKWLGGYFCAQQTEQKRFIPRVFWPERKEYSLSESSTIIVEDQERPKKIIWFSCTRSTLTFSLFFHWEQAGKYI